MTGTRHDLDRHVDHHACRPPAGLGWCAYQTVQALIHRTQTGWDEPAEIYEAISGLTAALHALPQLLRQAGQWIDGEYAAGRLHAGDGTLTDPVVSQAGRRLTDSVVSEAGRRLTDSVVSEAGRRLTDSVVSEAGRRLTDAGHSANCLADVLDSATHHLANLAEGHGQ